MAINAAVNNIYQNYATQNGNGAADGLKNYTVNGNEVLFEETNGETFKVRVSANELDQLNGTNKTAETAKAQGATSADGKSSEEIQKEIDALNETKAQTLEEMEKIETEVERLAEDVKKKITEAAEQQDKRVEQYEEEVQNSIKRNVEAYVNANKSGEKMSQDELQANVANEINGFAPELGDIVSSLFVANSEIDLIDIHLDTLKSMATTVSDLESQISVKESQYESAKAAEDAAKAAEQQAKSCDPIGFKDAEGNQFDFIVMDADGFNTTSDFLGATGNWDAMEALNKNDDNIIDLNELKASNIGLVMTGKDGKQTIMDAAAISAMFGSDFSIDLKSYDKNGKYEGITNADNDGNGVIDQDLQGTFSLNTASGKLKGYNTLDDQEWLAERYGIAANIVYDPDKDGKVPATGNEPAEGEFAVEGSEELQEHVAFINQYTQTVKELREALKQAWENLGLKEEVIDIIGDSAKTVAEGEAAKFYEEIREAQAENETAPADENNEETIVVGANIPTEDKTEEDELKEEKKEEKAA